MARYFKTDPNDIVAFSFEISENTVFSYAIDSVSFAKYPVHLLVIPNSDVYLYIAIVISI
jgi:hypothetical protein